MVNFDELEFKEDGHIYLLNGVEIPSVSKVIEPVSMSTYGNINQFALERAAARGTAVHQACEDYVRYGIEACDEKYSGYFQSFLGWYESHDIEPIGIEMRFYHKLMRYAGTADLVAKIDGAVTLVDYKTSQKVIDRNYRLQTEAYVQALKSHGIEVEKKMILHLTDSEYKEIYYPTQDKDSWMVFGACKVIYDYNRR